MMNSFFQFLGKHKLYTIINLFGLAVSLTFVILISDYAFRQLLTDSFHENRDRIFLLAQSEGFASYHSDALLLKDAFPEIESFCRISTSTEQLSTPDREMTLDHDVLYVDSTFFHIFSYRGVSGDLASALDARDKCVITKTFASQLFGSEDPMGQTIKIASQENPLTVTAVIEDFDRTIIPETIGLLVRFEMNPLATEGSISIGGPQSIKTFLLGRENADLSAKLSEIETFLKENSLPFKYAIFKTPCLIPFKDLMFSPQNSVTGGEGLLHGDLQMVRLLIVIALAILLFAVINYVNLTVAQTGMRAKEMATRELLGARKREITLRFIAESILMTIIASLIAIGLAVLLEEKASALFGGIISVSKDINVLTVSIFILFVLVLGLISGVIPAYAISRYKPVDIVKGSLGYRSKMVSGKIFIVVQNIITIVLIAACITIFWQIKHLREAPLGFRTENILEVPYRANKVSNKENYDKNKIFTLKNELQQLAFVEYIGMSNSTLSGSSLTWSRSSSEEGKSYTYSPMSCDRTYAFDIFGLELVRDNQLDGDAYYPDEDYLDMYNMPHDTTALRTDGDDELMLIGGVVRNVHVGDVVRKSPPLLIHLTDFVNSNDDEYPSTLTVKLRDKTNQKEAVKTISAIYKAITDEEADCMFVEEVIEKHFEKEKKLSTIVLMFTIIAIIISVLGLLAMSTYFTRVRTREVGVRKVFGSTTSEVLGLLLWEFIRPMFISFVAAIPVVWIIMGNWLENYSYRIDMNVWILLSAGLFSFAIAVLTVLWQTTAAARKNPVVSIKTE